MYEVLLSNAAERDMKRLPAKMFKRIVGELRALTQEPRPVGSRKLSGSGNDHRLRVGDYRVIYEIDDGSHEVRVMRVRHRREAYR